MSDDHVLVLPLVDFHEVWWIFSAADEEWAGLRVAHFRKTVTGDDIVVIQGEVDRRRFGVRIWNDVRDREGWRKVKQIALPTRDEVEAVLLDDNAR